MDTRLSSSPPASQFVDPNFTDDTRPRCTVCGKVFKRMYALERHIVVHDPHRERLEHKCPYEGCKFSSLQKSNVKTHIGAVHEKIKHTCTLPCLAEDVAGSGVPQSGRCGRIFSDAPALIRHEKRAHNFYRRGPNARPRPKSPQAMSTRPAEQGGSTSPEGAETPSVVLCGQGLAERSPSDEKVQYWLQGSDVRPAMAMEWDSDNATPSVATFARNQPHNCESGQYTQPTSTSVASSASVASASDAESIATGSLPSSISTSPSPAPPEPAAADSYYMPVSSYNQSYSQGYYYPYPNPAVQTYDVNVSYPLHAAQFAQAQSQAVIAYNSDNASPPIEALLADVKPGAFHNAGAEWDGTVTMYRAFFE